MATAGNWKKSGRVYDSSWEQ